VKLLFGPCRGPGAGASWRIVASVRKADLDVKCSSDGGSDGEEPTCAHRLARMEAQHAKAKLRPCGSGDPCPRSRGVRISAYRNDKHFGLLATLGIAQDHPGAQHLISAGAHIASRSNSGPAMVRDRVHADGAWASMVDATVDAGMQSSMQKV
jgi:hypothetical protein